PRVLDEDEIARPDRLDGAVAVDGADGSAGGKAGVGRRERCGGALTSAHASGDHAGRDWRRHVVEGDVFVDCRPGRSRRRTIGITLPINPHSIPSFPVIAEIPAGRVLEDGSDEGVPFPGDFIAPFDATDIVRELL